MAIDWTAAGDDALAALLRDVPGFRERRGSLPLRPYESLDPIPRQFDSNFAGLIEDRLANGFSLKPHSIPSIVEPIDWPAHVRPFALHLDAWEPISELLMGYSLSGNQRWLAGALAFARGWVAATYEPSMRIGPDPAALDAALGAMRWFDMSVGFRVYRLAYLVDVMARDRDISDDEVRVFLGSLVLHHQLLARDDFHRGHNNHGFYQAMGELAAARRFDELPFFAARRRHAAERFSASIAQQFHPSGAHREHSPGYHLMVLGSLIGAKRSGLIDDPEEIALIDRAEEALTWFVQPGGALVTFGDTDPKALNRARFPAAMFDHAGLRFHASGGQTGAPPPAGTRLFRSEGYAVARSGPPTAEATDWWHLALMGAFHSRVHKHADDLSIVWSDQGQQMLIDPGSYGRAKRAARGSTLLEQGFWYEGAERVYVESTRAHNTVEIDGRSYDRKRPPYGSIVRSIGEQHGLIVADGAVIQFGSISHWRAIVLAPGEFLVVIDRLSDQTGAKHDYRQRFLLHPEWSIAPDQPATGPLVATRGSSTGWLTVASLLPEPLPIRAVRGQTEPELLGWTSNRAWSLVPCESLLLEQLGCADATFATLFSLRAGVSVDSVRTTIDPAMERTELVWQDGERARRLAIRRSGEHGDVSAELVDE